jgi:hypothetical protein
MIPTARFALGAVAVSVLSAATPAFADPSCAGDYDLFSPLPDECLEVIDTDRPHQTDTPHLVPPGHTQIESAVAAVQLGVAPGTLTGRSHVVLFDDAYKFGLAPRVDLHLIVKHADYATDDRRLAPPGPLNVRAKIKLIEEDGLSPAVTLVPWVFIPLSPTQALRAGPLMFWGWELPAHMELEMNAGVLLSGKPKPPAAIVLASALTYTVVGNFRVFVDIYATGWDVALGTGALWAFTRDMQIDLGTYVGINGDEPAATPFLGFSFRR